MRQPEHLPTCLGREGEGVFWETSANAAAGTAYRAYSRSVCRVCGASTPWVRSDPWRYKFPDEEE